MDPSDSESFFPARGDVAAAMRAKDWSDSPLGLPATWAPSLRTVLRLMLSSRYAMWMGWGPELTFFYNDAYVVQTLGAKHPGALGRSAREVWAEIWDTVGPRIERVVHGGDATWDEGLLLFIEREGVPQETYHTFSYSPVPGDKPSEIAGLFCVVIEETERIINDRRIALLRDFTAILSHTKDARGVFAALEKCLQREARDLPFSLTYLFDSDGKTAELASQSSFETSHPAAAKRFALGDPSPWPFEAILRGAPGVVVDLPLDQAWPKGPWERAPSRALLVPIAQQGATRPAGVFIAGLNPHLSVGSALSGFVELFVGQLAAGLSNATAYEETRKRAEALAELDRAKTAFFSNVSHEFRTPLTLMLGPTEDALASPERALTGTALETVHRNEQRLLKLVNALLDFSRIEAGRIRAAYVPTDLSALTTDLASAFRSAIDRAELAFEVDCRPAPEKVYVDHDMWEKIVLNLLSNALKFTFEGTISVQLSYPDGYAELRVRDTGVGIEAAELPRLFERFHRIEGTRARTHEGSGIGLALVHDLVALHGGSIEAESAVGKGTTFTIRMPRGTAHIPPDRLQESLAPTGASAPLGSGAGPAYLAEALRWIPDEGGPAERTSASPPSGIAATVLVVDDNADMRDYLARLLRQHWNVVVAADGEEALAVVEQARPDLVLSDVMMPRLDGFGLLRRLRAGPQTATTPIILLSARAGEEATSEGLRAGADDYLVKPFSASALLVRVEAQLSAARLRETVRRATEAERERLALMVQESPAAIAVLRGRSLTIELANPLILRAWQKTAAVVGQPIMQAIPELRGQGFEELLLGVLDRNEVYRGNEVLARFRSGPEAELEDHYFDFVYAPIRGDEGKAVAVYVDAYEVTDKVIARRHLEQLRQEAEASNRLKDEFLATMSHELRTPLNAILGWTALIRQGQGDQVTLDRALGTIERNARAQARLIEDVLDVSRIISGKLQLETTRVNLVALALAATDVVRPAAEAKRVNLVLEIAPDERVDVMADPDRLQQIVWNLLSNAVKFTPPDGTVALRVEQVGSQARLVVKDTGLGLSAEHLPFIFERFRQVDSSTTRKYGGLGLGLAIVRHLVDLHGGTVKAESAGPNQGSTFTVDLPIRAVHRTSPVPEQAHLGGEGRVAEGPRQGKSRRLSGVKVLVVDDDLDSRTLVQVALERSGASVMTLPSAEAALAFLVEHRVDVLVSDIGMPEEDGFSLLRRVRALPKSRGGEVPAIALTAYARAEDAARSHDVGYQLHLAKPADIEELVRAVAALVPDVLLAGS